MTPNGTMESAELGDQIRSEFKSQSINFMILGKLFNSSNLQFTHLQCGNHFKVWHNAWKKGATGTATPVTSTTVTAYTPHNRNSGTRAGDCLCSSPKSLGYSILLFCRFRKARTSNNWTPIDFINRFNIPAWWHVFMLPEKNMNGDVISRRKWSLSDKNSHTNEWKRCCLRNTPKIL